TAIINKRANAMFGGLNMKKFLWDLFMKSGSIEAFLGFKEFEAAGRRENTPVACDKDGELSYEH
ncbi:MAG: hypothetical protein LUC92_04365, partial [Clostridiales bacterium]|nr:hypothetical protein [Clostridiales bacterium]